MLSKRESMKQAFFPNGSNVNFLKANLRNPGVKDGRLSLRRRKKNYENTSVKRLK